MRILNLGTLVNAVPYIGGFFALDLIDAGLLDSVLSQTISPEKLGAFLHSMRSCVHGTVIPTTSLDSSWVSPLRNVEDALRLAVRVSLAIQHVGHGNPSLELRLKSTLGALATGRGYCFHKASLYAAAIRKSGVPAQVVGRMDFNGSSYGNNHWWVETLLPAEGVVSVDLDFYTKILGPPGRSVEAIVTDLLTRYDLGMPLGPINMPRFARHVDDRIVVAEIPYPP